MSREGVSCCPAVDPAAVDRLHADGEQILKPLRLSVGEADDLIVFIESLSDYRTQWRRDLPKDRIVCN